jgi:hypothetical protein
MTIVLDIIFALSQSIPELDCPVTRSRDNLPVIGTEADRQYIGGMADESTGCCASVEVPQTKCVVPRRGKGELAVRRDNNVGNEVIVSMQDAFGVSVCVIVAGQLPYNDCLVWM